MVENNPASPATPTSLKRKNPGLDVFRVLAALIVFAFHSNLHIGCTFGPFTGFISVGAIFMTGFFMLSGYCLYLGYNQKDLTQLKQVGTFYKKRFFGIMPTYYIIGLLYVVILGTETLKQVLLVSPIQILGLQAVFSSLFSVSHNSGTWFISCLLLCYLIYPFAQEMLKQMSHKHKFFLLLPTLFIVLYGPVIVKHFGLQTIYSNPFFRVLEFLIGILLASEKAPLEAKKQTRFLFHPCSFIAEFAVLLLFVSLALRTNKGSVDYTFYNWIVIPVFMLMLVTLSGISAKFLENSKLLNYASSISYVFFLSQFFTWPLTMQILELLGTERNIVKLPISFLICVVISVLLHETLEKRLIKKIFKNSIK